MRISHSLVLLSIFCLISRSLAAVCGGLDCGAASCCLDQSNGAMCYTSSQYTCVASGSSYKLCPSGSGAACGTSPSQYCYNPSQYSCVNNQLVQGGSATSAPTTTTQAPATQAPVTQAPTQSTTTKAPTTTTQAPTQSGSNTCGGVNCGTQSCCLSSQNTGMCYSSSAYSCSNGVLCPSGFQGCGQGCYNPSQYSCVNGQLQQGGSGSSSTTAPTTTPTNAPSTTTTTTTTTTAPTSAPCGTPVKLYGVDYNPRTSTGACPTLEDVEQDVTILATITYRLRLYSIDDCNAASLLIQAVQNTGVNITITLGIWLDQYYSAEFTDEYTALLNTINTVGLGHVEAILVGSETQYRGDFSAALLVSFLQNISATLNMHSYNHISVATADVIYNLENLPEVTNAESSVYVNEFPYWEGTQVSDAPALIEQRVAEMQASVNKPVIVSETGWPTCGQNYGSAAVGTASLQSYFQQTVCYFNAHNIGYFWFQAFDEPWQDPTKQGGAEQCFGLLTADKQIKAGLTIPVVCPC